MNLKDIFMAAAMANSSRGAVSPEQIEQAVNTYLEENPVGIDLAMSGAAVGQTVKITAVDDKGVPTAWEAVDFPSGGGGDWNASEGEPGYISNRTHYTEAAQTAFNRQTVQFEDGVVPLEGMQQLKAGTEYYVAIWIDDALCEGYGTAEPYTEEDIELGVMCAFTFNHNTISPLMVISAYPEYVELTGASAVGFMDGFAHSCDLEITKQARVKQIDKKFIPEKPIPFFDLTELGVPAFEEGKFSIGKTFAGEEEKLTELLKALEKGLVRIRYHSGEHDETFTIVAHPSVDVFSKDYDGEEIHYPFRAYALGSYLFGFTFNWDQIMIDRGKLTISYDF